jgi:hypothetical protein
MFEMAEQQFRDGDPIPVGGTRRQRERPHRRRP